MNFAAKQRILHDSSDEEKQHHSLLSADENDKRSNDFRIDSTVKSTPSELTLSSKIANLKNDKRFINTDSDKETDGTETYLCTGSQVSNQLDFLSGSATDSDENVSPVLKRFPSKRRRLLSEDSIPDQRTNFLQSKLSHDYQLSSSSEDEQEKTESQLNKACSSDQQTNFSVPPKPSNDYQLSSSSEDEKESASNSKITTSSFYTANSNNNYVIPISRSRLAGPRSSAEISLGKGFSTNKNEQTSKNAYKKKRKRLKWLSSYEEDDGIDENFQKNEFDSDSSFSDGEDGPTISLRMQKKIIDFFENSSEEELTTISQCSIKKATVLVSLRPFKSWNDLVSKIDNSKVLNQKLLSASVDLIRERAAICRLMEECSKISKQLQAEFDKLQDANTQSPKKFCNDVVVQQQPKNITASLTLKPYQMIGLNWLALLHRNSVNGILADEMGLGKTIQTISFLAYLQSEGISNGPHLVVVPSSTLDNWIREFSVWCPSLSIVIYSGKPDERKSLRIKLMRGYLVCNVILTTYNLAISVPEDRTLFKKLGVHYAIFDEGHMLKNMSSLRFQHLMRITAEHRLLLTGTPLQNNLLELMSLLRFVMPHMFKETTSSLIRIFSHSGGDNSSKFARQRINHAKLIMQPFVLRRLKNEVLQQLPKKVETIYKCDLTPSQQRLYEKVKAKFSNKYVKQNLPKSELKNVFVELRKAANHPLLRREHYTDSTLQKLAKMLKNDVVYAEANEVYIFEDMQVMNDFELHSLCLTSSMIKTYKLSDSILLDSGKFNKLDEILPEMKANGKRILLFSQFTMMMDVIETYMKLRGHSYMRLDGSTPVGDRLDLIDRFNSDSSYFAFILSTRAGGLGINLTSASVVILHDIDSNPYNDKQAEDRCHRLGQVKDVEVIKLIGKNTIEEGMYQCAQYKLRLEKEMQEEDEDFVDMASLITQSLQ